jgi:hypothetical protein
MASLTAGALVLVRKYSRPLVQDAGSSRKGSESVDYDGDVHVVIPARLARADDDLTR